MEITNTPENQLFNFSYEFLRQAHDIYRQYCFENDFINRCTDRLKDEIGMCNLPYSTLPDEKDILCEAYRLFCKAEDCNIPYNDTLDFVIDQIETSIEQGAVHGISPVLSPKVAIVIEDGILSAAYTTDPQIQIQIVELDKNYASSEERDLIYDTLNQDDTLQLTDYLLSIPGYQKTLRMEGND